MDGRDAQRRLEAWLADALRADDPAAALLRAPDGWREAVGAIDPDGLRIAALMVLRLRFERLVQGSSSAAEWFDRDGAAFTAVFRRYHREVSPSARTPAEEAVAFAAWTDARDAGE